MDGPQIVRRYRRNASEHLPPASNVAGASLEMLATTELDMLVRGLARTVGAQAGLLAVSDEAGEVLEVLGLLATAHLDALTGCLNYAAIRHELEREIRRSERHHLSLTCCFVDLDDFKRVNDLYGHLYGSSLLVEVAATLGGAVRSEDTLGRYGGDEFVAILPETDEKAGVKLAQRIRSMLSAPSNRSGHRRVDASIGVAQWRPGRSSEEMLEAADLALHAAKAAGGGTVVGASEVPQMPLPRGNPVSGRSRAQRASDSDR